MKCPKCGYLGFDHVDRCRNCGYEFLLSRDVHPEPELPLRVASDTQAFADLPMMAPRSGPSASADVDAALEKVLAAPLSADPASQRLPAVSRPATPAADDLPLFGGAIANGAPLITRASPPRPPLAVRRATLDIPRVRTETPHTPTLDLQPDVASAPDLGSSKRGRAGHWADPAPEPDDTAGIGARVVASLIDLFVLAIVDAAVVYFTMQICGLTPADLNILPKGPLLAFLLVQNGGYLVAFTAGGQTLGKMAARIKVVAVESGSTLDVGRAALRTLLWALLAVPAGLGFLPAVFSSDHRGLHDRFAGTRVVRASA